MKPLASHLRTYNAACSCTPESILRQHLPVYANQYARELYADKSEGGTRCTSAYLENEAKRRRAVVQVLGGSVHLGNPNI